MECMDNLLENLNSNAISASSSMESYEAENVRFGLSGWKPSTNDQKLWLEADLKDLFDVKGFKFLTTVKSVDIFTSRDGENFQPLQVIQKLCCILYIYILLYACLKHLIILYHKLSQ